MYLSYINFSFVFKRRYAYSLVAYLMLNKRLGYSCMQVAQHGGRRADRRCLWADGQTRHVVQSGAHQRAKFHDLPVAREGDLDGMIQQSGASGRAHSPKYHDLPVAREGDLNRIQHGGWGRAAAAAAAAAVATQVALHAVVERLARARKVCVASAREGEAKGLLRWRRRGSTCARAFLQRQARGVGRARLGRIEHDKGSVLRSPPLRGCRPTAASSARPGACPQSRLRR